MKPGRLPVADASEQFPVGFPGQKSCYQGEDLFPTAEWGYVTGTSPQSKASHRKAAGQPFEFAEGQREILGESLDLEASAAFKKKKKKPKQKRSHQPRVAGAEMWEEPPERLQTPPCAAEPPKRSPKEFTKSSSSEILGKEMLKPAVEQQPLGGQSLPTPPAAGEPTKCPFLAALAAKPAELGRAAAVDADPLRVLSRSHRARTDPSEEQNEQGSPAVPPAQASPLEMSLLAESRHREGQLSKEIKGAEAVPLAKPPLQDEKVAPEGRAVLGGKPRAETSDEVLTKSPTAAKLVDPIKGESTAAVTEASSFTDFSPGDRKRSSPAEMERPPHCSADPFSPVTKAGAAKPLALTEIVGGDEFLFGDTSNVVRAEPSEPPAGASPRVPREQPKKRGSDGRNKRMKNPSEQRLFLPEEEMTGLSKAPAAEVAEPSNETGFVAKSKEAGSSSTVETTVAASPAGVEEKAKQRSGDRKSRKAAERTLLEQPLCLEAANRVGKPEQVREKSDSAQKLDLLATSQPLDATADTAKLQTLATASLMENLAMLPTAPSELADFPSSAYPFILDLPGKKTECPPPQAKGIGGSDQSAGLGFASLEGSVLTDPSSVLPVSKPQKRTSDGRSKKSGKSPTEEPLLLETKPEASKPPEKLEAAKATSSTGKDGGPADVMSVALPDPVKLEGQAGRKEKDLSLAMKESCIAEPLTSDHKMNPAQSEWVALTKEMPSSKKEQEASSATLEHLVAGITGMSKASVEELKSANRENQSHQVHGILEAKHGLAGPAAILEAGDKAEATLSSDNGKGRHLDSLGAEAVGQVSVRPLAGGAPVSAKEGKTREAKSSLGDPFVGGREEEMSMGAKVDAQPKGRHSAGSGREAITALSHRQDPSAKPAKRGSDGKSKTAVSSTSEQPAVLPVKADAAKEHSPKITELEDTMGETEFVDENRNIKNLPPGHSVLWQDRSAGFLGPFTPTCTGDPVVKAIPKSQGLEDASLEHASSVVGEQSGEHLPLLETLKDSSRDAGKNQRPPQGDTAKLDSQEAMIEASLLVRAGDETREKRKKSKRPPSAFLPRQDNGGAKDPASCSVLADAEGGQMNLLEKMQGSGLASSESPVENELKALAVMQGSKSVGGDPSIPPADFAAMWENEREAETLQSLTAVLVGGKAKQAWLVDDHKGDEQKVLESLGSKAGADKALEAAHMEEVASSNKPKDISMHLAQDDVTELKISPPAQVESGMLRVIAETKEDVLGLRSETVERIDPVQQTDTERGSQASRETKKEERAKAPEQIKGYMRPTKSRGLPAPSPRAIAPEQGKRKALKAGGLLLQRQEKGVCL